MQQRQFNQDFRSIVTRFCLIGIGFFVLFTVTLYFSGAAMLEMFGSGFLFYCVAVHHFYRDGRPVFAVPALD